jgi:hypothetical protein
MPPPLDELGPPFRDQKHRGAIRQMNALSDPVSRQIDIVDHIRQLPRESHYHPATE